MINAESRTLDWIVRVGKENNIHDLWKILQRLTPPCILKFLTSVWTLRACSGRHGEFDCNDEDRAICEDMFAMRSRNHDADLEVHYGWENKMNYDCDGYADERLVETVM